MKVHDVFQFATNLVKPLGQIIHSPASAQIPCRCFRDGLLEVSGKSSLLQQGLRLVQKAFHAIFFFFLYIIFMFLVLINIFLAILNDGSHEDLRTLKETWPNQAQRVGSIKHHSSEPSLARAVVGRKGTSALAERPNQTR